ncbi:MAG: GNAT family N-acetyltransferase [Planctomycetota bacterium]
MTAQLGRFLVRDINPWEGPRVFALTGDAQVMRYMGFRRHDSVEQASALIAQYREAPSRYQAVVLDGDPADILGIIGLEVRGHQATMTVMFRRDWKARGAGREFSVPFVQWIFTHPKIWRVWAYCHVDNIAVQRLLQRMGAECEGRLRRFEYFPNVSTEPQDVFIYSIVR